ncbi:unnamed protein product [Protopolystoma xenopodis]|uniref:Uncharacterized protein n=1 Tax=Protopolystoma xenopodis TaxID=117903 RepID=A0A448WKH6_9PLAT|nr:unnamed protein product [Protopolystoma xenopodis]
MTRHLFAPVLPRVFSLILVVFCNIVLAFGAMVVEGGVDDDVGVTFVLSFSELCRFQTELTSFNHVLSTGRADEQKACILSFAALCKRTHCTSEHSYTSIHTISPSYAMIIRN